MWNCDRAVQCVRPLHCGCSAVLSRGGVTSASSPCVSLCAHPPSCSRSTTDPPSSRTGQDGGEEEVVISSALALMRCSVLHKDDTSRRSQETRQTFFCGNGIGRGREFCCSCSQVSTSCVCWIGPQPHFGFCKASHLLCVNDANVNIVETLLKLRL